MKDMFSERSHDRFGDDLYNDNHTRNVDNTSRYDYNCGGYALGTISWYLPSYEQDTWGGWCWDTCWNWEEMVEITEAAVQYMLEDFFDLRVIKHLREVRHDEYAIAFRVSSDGDFHYVKQERGRTWSHKCGASEIRTMTRWEVLHTHWCGRYDGPMILLAKKRG